MFCRLVRSRSAEHKNAIPLLMGGRIYSQVISILRQELDSMVRVIYLLSIDNLGIRNQLINASVEGRSWIISTDKGKKHKITDREMVDFANSLKGWAEYVYRFGCSFIHLSNLHDHLARDPMEAISEKEKEAIFNYMRQYHGGPLGETFRDLIPYLPNVFDKISSNLECYLKELQEEKILKQETEKR